MCNKCVCGGDVLIIRNPMIDDQKITDVNPIIHFPYVSICKKCKEVFPLKVDGKLLKFKKLGAEIVWNNIAMDLYMMNEIIKDPMKTIQLYKDYKKGNDYE